MLVLGIAGCSVFGSSRKPPDPLPAATGALRPVALWNVAVGPDSGVGFAPVALGDAVFAAASDGTVVRVDLGSGRPSWRTAVGKPLTAGVGTDGMTTVVAARDGTVVALDAEGKVKWTTAVGAEVVTPPAVADGLVVLRTTDNRVVALEADGGKRRWSYQRQNPPLVLRHSGGIAMVPGAAFVGMPGGRLVALATATGAPRWEAPLSQPRGTTELERIADVVGSPLLIGRELCAVTYQGRLGCLDAASGRPVWTREFSSAVGLDIDARGVVAPDENDTLHGFDRLGEPIWKTTGFAGRRLSAPLIVGSAVAIGDFEGNLLWFSRDDGRLAAVSRTDGKRIVAPAAAVGGTLVVQTAGGTLHAFRIE
jgi:outer membrane protein assembly factor BamB